MPFDRAAVRLPSAVTTGLALLALGAASAGADEGAATAGGRGGRGAAGPPPAAQTDAPPAIGVDPAGAPAAETPADAETLQVALGIGPSALSDTLGRTHFATGFEYHAWARIDAWWASLDGSIRALDGTSPDRFQVQASAYLLFLMVQDFTFRESAGGNLLRLMAGLGGQINLQRGSLQIGLGVATQRFGGPRQTSTEAYGAYVGFALHLHLGPVQNDLSLAVHGIAPPPDLYAMSVGTYDLWRELRIGVTSVNRTFVQLFRVGPAAIGLEMTLQWEDLLDGRVLFGTVGGGVRLGV
ncbi:MAG: hypothetical protein ACFCGT_19830 [Sandaracinaceae bacterium]